MRYFKNQPKLKAYSVLFSYLLMGVLCFVCAATAQAADNSAAPSTRKKVAAHLKVTIEVVDGTGDDPMIVIWAESRKGFEKTLYWFSKDSEWYPDLTVWDGKRSKAYKKWQNEPGIDAVMGPTIPWGGTKSCKIPITFGNVDLLSGQYRLRIEQCKDKGGHFKKFKLPLPKNFKGGKLDKTIGYMKSLNIEVVR